MLLVALAAWSLRAEPVVVGRVWPDDQRLSLDHIDHRAWAALLERYVDEQGQVDYARWHDARDDRLALEDYLTSLSRAEPEQPASRASRLAFGINAYNALTIHGILREYPTDSIRRHTPRLVGYHIWKDLHLVIGDVRYSLEDIEHQMLRPLGEPRIHFAIVCASRGCPPLSREPYVPARLDDQLATAAGRFFADATKFRAEPAAGTFYLSPILKWFAADFGTDAPGRLRTIAPYLPDDASRRLAEAGTAAVVYLEYDWSLNDQDAVARTTPSAAR